MADPAALTTGFLDRTGLSTATMTTMFARTATLSTGGVTSQQEVRSSPRPFASTASVAASGCR